MRIETDDLGPSKGQGAAGSSNEPRNMEGADEEHKIIEGAGSKNAQSGVPGKANQLSG